MDRITTIHRLFNELHLELGRFATRNRNDLAEGIGPMWRKIDELHHDFAILIEDPGTNDEPSMYS